MERRRIPLVLCALALLAGCGEDDDTDHRTGPVLTWAPPALRAPIAIEVPPEGGYWAPPPDRDCRIDMPKVPVTDTVKVVGCHNVVLIGGETSIGGVPDGNPAKPGLYLSDYTGTLHVEGWKGGGSGLTDALWISTRFPNTTAQVENVEVTEVHGQTEYPLGQFPEGWPEPDEHPDVIQLWQGPTRFRAERVTGRSSYQGFTLDSTAFGPPQYTLNPARSVDIRHTAIALTGTGRSCYAYFFPQGAPRPRLRDVYCDPGVREWAVAVVPRRDLDPSWWGRVRRGRPGSRVLIGERPGVRYHSPGYRR